MRLNDTILTPQSMKTAILHHLTFTIGKDAPHASLHDWRMALSFAIRDQIVEPWFASTRRTWAEDRKRVYYLSMEFLIGRLLGGCDDQPWPARHGGRGDGRAWPGFPRDLVEDEPDAALGNGGLGRLAACFMELMATVGCPAYGYGIRYEHGLFRQRFQQRSAGGGAGRLADAHATPGSSSGRKAAYTIGFKGDVEIDGRARGLGAGRNRARLGL